MIERNEKGQLLPGHTGNPGGRPKGIALLIRGQTGEGEELVCYMLKVFRGQVRGLKPHHRMEAATWLSDRAFGKPTQAMEVIGDQPVKVNFIVGKGYVTEQEFDRIMDVPGHVVEGDVVDGSGQVVG